MTIDDKIYDRFLNTIRDGEADVGTIDIRIDGRWQTIDFRPALARLVAERDDAIAQMNDADNATDNATQIAERIVRSLKEQFDAVIDRLEKQSAARDEAAAKREATLHAENERLRAAVAEAASVMAAAYESCLCNRPIDPEDADIGLDRWLTKYAPGSLPERD